MQKTYPSDTRLGERGGRFGRKEISCPPARNRTSILRPSNPYPSHILRYPYLFYI
jgi:hypothetical protein